MAKLFTLNLTEEEFKWLAFCLESEFYEASGSKSHLPVKHYRGISLKFSEALENYAKSQ